MSKVEHEFKLAVWPGFSVPELGDLLDGGVTEARDEQLLDATYFDAADLRLIRAGITVRHRSGDADDGWTVKLPSSSPVVSGGINRTEIVVSGKRGRVPQGVLDLVAAQARSAPLDSVARLETRRRPLDLLDADGALMACVVDDEVSILDSDGRVTMRFREIEVEAGAADETLMRDIVGRLRGAGAEAPEPTPKVVRALGPRALDPPDLQVRTVHNGSTAAEVLSAALGTSVARLLREDPLIRSGESRTAVHAARVATRRLRSHLRTFRRSLEDGWVTDLRAELAWLAGALGPVRDGEVLRARLVRSLEDLGAVADEPASFLLARLDADLHASRAVLLDVLRSRRYLKLLDRLVDAAVAPRLLSGAAVPASKVLPAFTGTAWTAFAKRARRLGSGSSPESVHQVRLLAKRARYAADVAALAVGGPAQRLSRALVEVQDVLGAHQDAVASRTWLRQVANDAPTEAAVVAGQLIERDRQAALGSLAAWPGAWRRVSKGKLRAWLKT